MTLSAFVHIFGPTAAGKAVLQDWERIMALAARNDRLAEDASDHLAEESRRAGEETRRLVDLHTTALRNAVDAEKARFEALVEAMLDDDRLKADDRKAIARAVTEAPPNRLGSDDKRRRELLRWRASVKSTQAIFSAKAR